MQILIFTFLFGLIIGSFLNVCIYRIPRKLSLTDPVFSQCPGCNKQLLPWMNIPVVSWLCLRAKCWFCKKPISGQYPLVEILSGFACAASYSHFGITPTGILIYLLTATLIVISFIDFEFKIIPDVISFPGMTLGLIVGIIAEYTNIFAWPITTGAINSLIGFLVGGGFFYIIAYVYYFFTKQIGIGGGDIKLMAMVGALLGWEAIPPSIFVGSFVGAIVGILMMLFQGTGRKTEIPFGPWLSVGTILYMFTSLPFFRM